MRVRIWTALLILSILAGCGQSNTQETVSLTPLPTTTLAQPGVVTTSVPDPEITVRSYLDAWVAEDYDAMYALLTSISKDAITLEDFTRRYADVANEAALRDWEYEMRSSLKNPQSAQVGYRVTMHSVLVGDFSSDTVMNLSLENGEWRVQWDEALILSELGGGNYLRMDYRIPSRANIYDREGHALVAQADAVALGLDTSQVDPETQDALLGELYRLTGIHPDVLHPRVENYRNYGWYLPIADVSADAIAPRQGVLASYAGVIMLPFRTRYYFDGGIAPHVVGYMSAIQEAEVEEYKRLGYRVDERVGRDGLEYWGEPYLAGKRGGALYLVTAEGAIITILAESEPEPSQAIYTTLDKDLQLGVQKALGDFKGAAVVLELNTGRVLAMASSPGFNPNLFEPSNYNYSYQINDLYDPDTTPLLNRATQGQYPLGSVFKIITMAAGLQSELYTPQSEYNCTYFFEELTGYRPNDWTYDHFLEDGRTQASGILTLPEGLMRSCNLWFWHIGLDFFRREMTTTLSTMAQSFGLGSRTGIEIGEETGHVPVPEEEVDAINLAIGQGDTQVTPLQVADYIAAVGNGGKLYEPKVIERIVPPDGNPTYEFTSTLRGELPVDEEWLKVIQDAMVSVVMNPRGTAYHVLSGFSNNNNIPIAGKTGTAQSGFGEPHAWFAGYTFAGRENKPDIAVVVLVENIGEGSDYAAPIFRRILEVYFLGRPQVKYPWEAQIGVIASPTPEVTDTPTPEVTETPTP
jgi:cell division protein FtsI/penicillin-binding protein 2